MDTKFYTTRVSVDLVPLNGTPDVVVSINNDILYSGLLSSPRTFSKDCLLAAGNYLVTVEYRNKTNDDPHTELIIKNITFNDICRDKFVWAGEYTPDYPEPWASQQRDAGYVLEPTLKNCNCLGWNGTWRLQFTAPIFTWIHGVENLGWIYD